MRSDDWVYEQPRAMGKAELAAKLKYRSTSYLFKLISQNEVLSGQLAATGYKQSQRFLSQEQCRLIYEVFGYPIISAKTN